MELMNLHISFDDKFLDSFILNARKFSRSKNTYIVISNGELNLTKSKNDVVVFSTDFNNNGFLSFLNKLGEIQKVFFHSYNFFFQELTEKGYLPKCKYYWVFYGYEIFSQPSVSKKLLLTQNKRIYKKLNPNLFFKFSFNPIQFRRNLINYRHYSEISFEKEKSFIDSIRRINYFAHFLENDFKEYIKPHSKKIEHLDWNFGGSPAVISSEIIESPKKENILVLGNSASIFNNHIDALYFLKRILKNSRKWKIFAPLSYSGSPAYVEEVLKTGKHLFGDSFLPQLEFLEKEHYFEIISSARAAVYFNIRSQAAGNISWFLRKGIPVFMLEENNLYKDFSKKGIKIFSIKKDLENFLSNDLLDMAATERNYEIFDSYFGEEAIKKKYRNLLDS